MSLSAAETVHKQLISGLITGTADALGATPNGIVVSALSPLTINHGVDLPSVCSDGIRRPNVLDYIDYLFQNPTIEQFIKTSLGNKTYAMSITPGSTPRQFYLTITNTGVLPTLVVRSVTTPGTTLPTTLTLATQVTLTSGTTFTNASSASTLATRKWDSGFSSAIPLGTGYITATPGSLTSSIVTFSMFGLATTALSVTNSTIVPSYTMYGFTIERGPNSSYYRVFATAPAPVLSTQVGAASYSVEPTLTLSYNGSQIQYYINGVLATTTSSGQATTVSVSLNTLYANGFFSTTGDSLKSVTWGNTIPGPKGTSGSNGNQGIQGVVGVTGPQGPGFTSIGGTTTSGNLLLANGTTNSAYAQSGLSYSSGVLRSSAMTTTNGAMTAAISSTISGVNTLAGFLSYSQVYTSLVNGTTIVLSGLTSSGLYICSALNPTATTYTRLTQFYVVKIGNGFIVTTISTTPTSPNYLLWTIGSGSTSFSIYLSSTYTNTMWCSVGITLLANTPNLS